MGLQVRLKDVVDCITSIIAQNAVSSSLESCVTPILKSAAADISAQAEQVLQRTFGPVGSSNSGTSAPFEQAKLCLDNIAEDLVDSTVSQVLPEHSALPVA